MKVCYTHLTTVQCVFSACASLGEWLWPLQLLSSSWHEYCLEELQGVNLHDYS